MTDKDNAAQPVLTDDEILAATLYGQSEARMIRNGRAIESALLSKLRAPVADERFRSNVEQLCAYAEGSKSAQIVGTVRRVRAALESAPVAGEAAYWLIYQDYDHKVLRFAPGSEGKPVLADGYSAMPLYAAPQASEAVDVFGSPLTPYGLLARALRAATGTTLMQMARDTGSTPAEISNYEFGRKAPDESWFERAALFFASNGIVVSPTALRQAHERAALSAQPGAHSDSGDVWKPQTPQQIAADMRSFARSEGFDWPDPDSAQPGAQTKGNDS